VSNDLKAVLDQAMTSTISRFVAALVPVLASVLGAGAYWLQNVAGINLQAHVAVAAAFVGTVVLGVLMTGWKWLEGRALFEKTATELAALYHLGQDHVDDTPKYVEAPKGVEVPTVPPGMQTEG
jgi:hypothetical protein